MVKSWKARDVFNCERIIKTSPTKNTAEILYRNYCVDYNLTIDWRFFDSRLPYLGKLYKR